MILVWSHNNNKKPRDKIKFLGSTSTSSDLLTKSWTLNSSRLTRSRRPKAFWYMFNLVKMRTAETIKSTTSYSLSKLRTLIKSIKLVIIPSLKSSLPPSMFRRARSIPFTTFWGLTCSDGFSSYSSVSTKTTKLAPNARSRSSLWVSSSTTCERTRRRSPSSALSAIWGSHRRATSTSTLRWSTLDKLSTTAPTATSHSPKNITFGYI